MNHQERIVVNRELARAGLDPLFIIENTNSVRIKYFNSDRLPFDIVSAAVTEAFRMNGRPKPKVLEWEDGSGWEVIIVHKRIVGNYELHEKIST